MSLTSYQAAPPRDLKGRRNIGGCCIGRKPFCCRSADSGVTISLANFKAAPSGEGIAKEMQHSERRHLWVVMICAIRLWHLRLCCSFFAVIEIHCPHLNKS